ncbi:Retinoblastoma-related protein 1 [Intoshia linei]|uniref:Retinoblastoma-related protein 1 n=1 Tax=Intoshia linei TaxID=1819745 RepID=A0A177B792_9BILA|nr:Retinoblastoma-related protein 1 [Intoshia linei]
MVRTKYKKDSPVRKLRKQQKVTETINDKNETETNSDLYERYCTACAELNMDAGTRKNAYVSYLEIKDKVTLDGDQFHWLACTLYITSMNASLKESVGNFISLTRLLSVFNLSWLNFFNKIRKMFEMNETSKAIIDKINNLEKKFSVSCVIYRKYFKIFSEFFVFSDKSPFKRTFPIKKGNFNINIQEIYSFCWTLYLHVKAHFPYIADDVINSYHLLICAIDCIYCDLYHEKRLDLINVAYVDDDSHVSIISKVCEMHQGVTMEAKALKNNWWQPYIQKLFERGALQGTNGAGFLYGIFDRRVYTLNKNTISSAYDEYLLKSCSFDERIFQSVEAETTIGVSFAGLNSSNNKFGFSSPLKSVDACIFERRNKIKFNTAPGVASPPHTPLTGRRYLADKFEPYSPNSILRHNIGILNSIINNSEPFPSSSLLTMLNQVDSKITENIKNSIRQLSEDFDCNYRNETSFGISVESIELSMSNDRLNECLRLYWKCFDIIVRQEHNRFKNNTTSLTKLLSKDVFHKALFGCCMEIVLFCHKSPRIFPWIIEIMNLHPFQFYKIIESMVRTLPSLSRDIVKHLNRIEESILEYQAWSPNSTVWDLIKQYNNKGPCCADVMLPATIQDSYNYNKKRTQSIKLNKMDFTRSPIIDPSLMTERTDSNGVFNSPISTALGFEKDNLKTKKNNSNDNKISIKIENLQDDEDIVDESKTLKINPIPSSLALFFRKVYHLSSVRMRNLCSYLNISWNLQQKIWTTIEYSLTSGIILMSNRHIDVLVMCGIYVVCKISKTHVQTFQNIMKYYRLQPQAQSHVYRKVFILTNKITDENSDDKRRVTRSKKPDKTEKNTISNDEYDDLIAFYNKVYVVQMKSFVSKFADYLKSDTNPDIHESRASAGPIRSPGSSPIPIQKKIPISPRRISQAHRVYVSPHKSRKSELDNFLRNIAPSNKKIVYCFDKSPVKDLKAINEMVKNRKK